MLENVWGCHIVIPRDNAVRIPQPIQALVRVENALMQHEIGKKRKRKEKEKKRKICPFEFETSDDPDWRLTGD